jgi:hypothetical protein
MISPTMSSALPVNSGYWRVIVDPKPSSSTNNKVDVTFVRGAATTVTNLSTTDPFGPAAATIVFTSVTLLDTPGVGDLSWLVPEANVDICWMAPQTPGVNQTEDDILYRWEGYFVSFEYGEEDAGGTLTVACNGAMKQMDNYLAYPEHLTQPMSYEYAIERQFDTTNRPDSRLRKCIPFKETALTDPDFAFLGDNPNNIFSSDNYLNYNSKDAIYNKTMSKFYKPININDGDIWSGLLTRSTGNFETVLSNYIQNLLESMQTPTGSFTLLLADGRQPYFKHRKRLTTPANDTLVVDVLWPGVKLSVTQDFTQKTNIVYGSGKGLSGDTFTNISYDASGSRSTYIPFAARKENYPRVGSNTSFNKDKMSKEVSLNFWAGLNSADAKIVAEKHLDLFSDPGITGQLTLNVDPKLVDGTGVARQTLSAGRSILVKGLFGNQQGIMFHVTEHSYSGSDNTVTLTLDSKYRNQLTVQEVRMRGKDSMVISRLLGIGQFKPNIDDLLFPWSYEQGSGFIPTGSKLLWDSANGANISIGEFPWTELTKNFPPYIFNASDADANSATYASLQGPANTTNANKNWTNPIPVLFSAAGTIAAIRFVAVKVDGTPYKVPFHVSLWYESSDGASGLTYAVTPNLPSPGGSTSVVRLANVVTENSPGGNVSGVLTLSNVENKTKKGTVTATLKMSAASNDTFLRLTNSNKIQIRDSKYIKKNPVVAARNTTADCFTLIPGSTDAVNRIVKFYVPTSRAISVTQKKVLKQTVKDIRFINSYSPSPRDAGLIPQGFSYNWGQHYPFYERAWERIEPEGNTPPDTAYYGPNTPIAGWGTFYELAGFYPGNGGIEQYSPATGLFSDDQPFSFDFTSLTTDNVISSDTPTVNTNPNTDGTYGSNEKKRASGNALIYCDQEYDEETGTLVPRKQSVYFIGRLFRQSPGGS